MNSGVEPVLIQPNQLAWAINSTQRGGFPRQRPGLIKHTLNFSQPYVEADFINGLFQGAGTYISNGGKGPAFVCCSISGRIYTINVSSGFAVADITIPGDPSGPNQPHAWFLQAERYLIVSDNQSRTFCWKGATAFRADPAKQVPIGGPSAYVKGRVWIARDNLYFGGDLVGNDPSLGVDNVIYFTENTYLNEGGAFSVKGGPITGMSATANIDTALGEGDLLVFNRPNVFAFDAPLDRTTWADLTSPIQRFGAIGFGAANHESIQRINGDAYFRAPDGVRSYVAARREFGQPGQTPISREVERAIGKDYQPLLYAASAVNFDNRYLMTCDPHWVYGHGVWHGGLVSVNFDLISTLRGKAEPAWEGLWTGLRILHIVTLDVKSETRCFIFALNDDDEIELWELTKDRVSDYDGEQNRRISHTYELRSFMAEAPETMKQLQNLSFWAKNISGEVDVTASYRPETTEKWIPWGAHPLCVKESDCEEPEDCQPPNQYHPIGTSRKSFGKPNLITDATGQPRPNCYEAQVKLSVEGALTLKRVQVAFTVLPETEFGDMKGLECANPESETCVGACQGESYCPASDFAYQI